MKRLLPLVLSTGLGIILLVAYFFNISVVQTAASDIQNWGTIISAFALGLAAINLVKVHSMRIARGGRDMIHSIVLLAGLAAMAGSGIFLGSKSKMFSFLFDNAFSALSGAFYAMTAFHLASASYRAFRARNLQAAALLVSGVLVMLGRAPIGEVMWSGAPVVSEWIMDVVNLAGSRAILISTAIGTVGVALRILTGMDRSHLGGSAD